MSFKTLRLRTNRRTINEIIVHCSATREGQNVSVEAIRKEHIKNRGFKDIGYHFVIMLDGEIKAGRCIDLAGAHCTNHNAKSIGVCYIGGVKQDGKTPKDTRTPAQKQALRELLRALREEYPHARIHSHRDFAPKACPSFDASQEYKDI